MTTPPTQRELLVAIGARLFYERGYTATGVRQIANAAGVPLGSFTNHYRSKERFALDVLVSYAEELNVIMAATLTNTERASIDRIEAYFDAVGTLLEQRGWAVGCLIPDLATEASPHSDPLRLEIVRVMQQQTDAFAGALRDLVSVNFADDAAAVLLAAWHGTLLRIKVERSPASLARFKVVLHRLLEEWAQSREA